MLTAQLSRIKALTDEAWHTTGLVILKLSRVLFLNLILNVVTEAGQRFTMRAATLEANKR